MSGSTSEDRIISIAIGELDNISLKSLKKGLFNPGVPVKQGAFWVHKISDRDLARKPDFQDTDFCEYLREVFSDPNNVVIGHAVCNDLFIIAKEGIQSKCKIIDTQYCSTKIFKTEKSSLNYLAKEYNLIDDFDTIKFHTAEGDVKVTHKLLIELLKHHTFSELIALSMEQFFELTISVDGKKRRPIYSIATKTPEILVPYFLKVKDPKMYYSLMFFSGNSELFQNMTKAEIADRLK
jgi:DNA polymerase III epsilon subunit-like protein